MDFNEYQKKAIEFAIYPRELAIIYPALGLGGETGEVLEKIKKKVRDGVFDEEAIKKEIGDVLWYLANLCDDLNFPMEEAAINNIKKLTDRKQRGVLHGSGDER